MCYTVIPPVSGLEPHVTSIVVWLFVSMYNTVSIEANLKSQTIAEYNINYIITDRH